MHRKIANPFRAFRRRVLVLAGIRRGKGKPQSEQFIEEGLRETGGNSTVIERLYSLLRSQRYFDYATDAERNVVDVAFSDLFDRSPEHVAERELMERLKSQTPHDQMIWLLKSPAFFANSQGWSESMVEQKVLAIENKLNRHETSKRNAA